MNACYEIIGKVYKQASHKRIQTTKKKKRWPVIQALNQTNKKITVFGRVRENGHPIN